MCWWERGHSMNVCSGGARSWRNNCGWDTSTECMDDTHIVTSPGHGTNTTRCIFAVSTIRLP